MDTLKAILSKYVRINKNLSELNAQASELRDNRCTVELDLAALYAHSTLPDQIHLSESDMMFNVKRPNKWKKGWSLSKKDLELYLKDILGERGGDGSTVYPTSIPEQQFRMHLSTRVVFRFPTAKRSSRFLAAPFTR
jgi:hypothetical protein